MENKINKIMVGLGVLVTAGITIIRCATMKSLQDLNRNSFELSTVSIVLFVVLFAILLLMTIRKKTSVPPLKEIGSPWKKLVSTAAIVLGGTLFVTYLIDAYQLIFNGVTPPPVPPSSNSIDRVFVVIILVVGLASAIFFVWLGIAGLSGKQLKGTKFAASALLPALWLWVRLLRYEISSTSAVNVKQSFYDFVMLIFALLFLFAFARYISGVGEKKYRSLLVFAICTFTMCLSVTITRFVMYVTNFDAAYLANPIAGVADFFVGLFALCVAVALTANAMPRFKKSKT